MLALIDGTNAAFRYKYSLEPSAAAAKGVSRAFEFCEEVGAKWAIVCLDAPGELARCQQDALYKPWRRDAAENASAAPYHFAAAERFADAGFWVERVAGEEADDLVGHYARKARGPVAVLSSDADVLQVMATTVACYTYGKRGSYDRVYPDAVLAEYGVTPDALPWYKALVGEEGLEGLPGFGPKRSRDFLTQYGTGDNLLLALSNHYTRRGMDAEQVAFWLGRVEHERALHELRALELPTPAAAALRTPNRPAWARL